MNAKRSLLITLAAAVASLLATPAQAGNGPTRTYHTRAASSVTVGLEARGDASFAPRQRSARGHGTVRVTRGHHRPGYRRGVRRYTPPRVWIPGHEVLRTERQWVPARTRQVWVPPRDEHRIDSRGRGYTVHIGGHYETVTDPGYYEERQVRSWVPGHWERC